MGDALIRGLAGRFQVSESMLFVGEFTSMIDQAATPGDPGSDAAAPDPRDRRDFRLRAAEYGVLARTELWLGLIGAARTIASADLRAVLEEAVASPHGPYEVRAVPVPADLRAVLTQIAGGIGTEQHVQGSRVTPPWWVQHHAGRVLAHSLRTAVDSLLSDIEAYLAARRDELSADDRPELLELKVTLIFAGLQLAERLATHGPQVQQAAEAIAELRHPAAGADAWPDVSFDQDRCTAMEEMLVRELAAGMSALPAQPHAGTEVDLFGRAYHVVVDAVFRALVRGRRDLAAEIFPVAMTAANRARDRLITDLAGQPDINQAVHGSAPLIDLMEISGYAFFLQELDGIWPAVRAVWDPATANPKFAAGLADVLAGRHGLVPGDMRRVRWQQQFDALLQARGLHRRIGSGFYGSPPASLHASPVVTTILAQGYSSPYEMADLFLIEYLATRPGVTDLKMTPQARRLRDAITAARQHYGDSGSPFSRSKLKPWLRSAAGCTTRAR
jgi:hypothetical protein